MNRFESFTTWYRTVIAAVFGVFAAVVNDYLAQATIGSPIRLVILSVTLILLLRASETALQILLTHWTWLRKRVFGRWNIEGWWADVTYDRATKEVLFGSLSRFRYESGQIIARGDSFDSDGRIFGTFIMRTTEYEEHELKYGFEWRLDESALSDSESARKGLTELKGYGELRFSAVEAQPRNYLGFFIDTGYRTPLFFQGELITDAATRKELDNQIAKKEFMRARIEQFAKDQGYTIRASR
ncbi:MAG: hypothetical protein F6K17_32585 [Okeania sp. SIO3C4]|nr:hypothetical protein [Okeania sp. SIO3C4]